MIETLVLFTFIAVIAELIISGRWVTFYFRKGLPLFIKSFQVVELPTISTDYLTSRFSNGITDPLVFHRIDNDEIGFREKFFSFRPIGYSPIMHGLIRIARSERKVSIIGYSNWFTIIFPITFLLVDYDFSRRQPAHSPTIYFLFGIMAVLYLIQFIRFNKVYKILEEKFSRKYDKTLTRRVHNDAP